MVPRKPKTIKIAKVDQHGEVLDGLKALGLTTVTSEQVTAAIKILHPHGIIEADRVGVLRAVFLHLKQRDRANNVER